MESPAVEVHNLNFKYEEEVVLRDVNLSFPRGSRVLVIGRNGAGKSTLLRILGGKHMHERNDVKVLGQSAFFETPKTMVYLGSDWRRSVNCVGNSVPYAGEIMASEMIRHSRTDTNDLARKEALIKLLGVNLEWRMNRISDGEVRRVQILMALMRTFDLLLLDEITVDLDVLTRINLLNFFKAESQRGCTVLYATHIFDGIDNWATHVIRVHHRTISVYTADQLQNPFYKQVYEWLKEDLENDEKKTNQS